MMIGVGGIVADARVLAVGFAGQAGIFLADMLNAFKVAGEILDLPALRSADLRPLQTTAGAGALLRAQLMNLRGDRKIVSAI